MEPASELHPLAKRAVNSVKVNKKAPGDSVIAPDELKRLIAAVREQHRADTQLSLDFAFASVNLKTMGMEAAAGQLLTLAKVGLGEALADEGNDAALRHASRAKKEDKATLGTTAPKASGVSVRGRRR